MKNILNSNPKNNFNEQNNELFRFLVEDSDLKGKEVLDLGCGFGWFCLMAEERGAKRIIGVEISEEDLKTAKKSIKSKNIEFIVGSALSIPLPDNSVDTVFAWEVIEHIPTNTEKEMLKEVERILKPGGKFYLSTPYNSFISKLFDPAFLILNHRHYDEMHFKKFTLESNLIIEDIKVLGRFWYLLDLLNLYFSKWILRREKLFEKHMLELRINEFINSKRKGYMAIYVKFKKTSK